ncbi:hypothetical protein BD413DRAFT_489381 [Trametes elegans]|nr:hypothetical protein BD413DRAFT_489381 [Trametes elegans]
MSYGYSASPSRSEPVMGRSLSTDFIISGQHIPTVVQLRPTRSVPPSFQTTHSAPGKAGLGLGLSLPCSLITYIHPRPERPRLRRQADLGLGTPLGGIPMRSMGRRVAASHLMSPVAPAVPASPVAAALRIATSQDGAAAVPARRAHTPPHPAITLTLADAFESESDDDFFGTRHYHRNHQHGGNDDDELPRYSFLPPGLSSPVPWPSPPVTPNTPNTRPMTSRTLAGPGMRAPVNITPPGAPIMPTTSRFGTHHHFLGLDHRAGGVADEEGLETPAVSCTRTIMPMAPRLPTVERITYDRL